MGKLFIVGTPIGNLNDVTKRQLETLENVDIILCEDTRHSLKLLNFYKIKNKLISYHKFNEKEKSPYLIDEIIKNKVSEISYAENLLEIKGVGEGTVAAFIHQQIY